MHTKLCTNICCVRRFLYLLIKVILLSRFVTLDTNTHVIYFYIYIDDNFCKFQNLSIYLSDRLCGLVVRVLGYRFGGPGSIPGTTRKKN
jgi:hypothetical protein